MDGSMAQLASYLSGLVGRRIEHIARVLYAHRGVVDYVDGPLEMEVDGRVVLFDGANDGESLRVRDRGWDDPFKDPVSAETREYIELHGRWQRVDCSSHEGFIDLVDQVITDVRLLRNEHGRTAGLTISVAARSVWFVVEGDECHVHWAHPIGFTEVKG